MDTSECDTNLLGADVLLPPRKRLLAGLKKQSFSESTSQCSQVNNHSPSLSSPNPLSEFDLRLSDLLKSYKNGSKMSPLEIAEAARSKAAKAAKAAEAARAAAKEKAAVAAKAVSAAKRALDLISSIPEDTHKLKKRVPVQHLYDRCGMDEELARRLHRAMNSSPRLSKHSLGSDCNNYKHKRLKISPLSERCGIGNGSILRDVIEGDMDFEGYNEKPYTDEVDDKVSSFSNLDKVHLNGRNKSRMNEKKMPLSNCSSKDHRTDEPTARRVPLLSVEPTAADNLPSVQITSGWKCQDFKASQYIKPDKVVQS